ncbi:MAG: hypothetical protein IPL87_03100 [Candidatus Moraniibacteriota bacterium]|nr:MAG: hypothetical protein IPL87_03100 [Candidatus Moranbacteria bacterium]
MDNIGDLCHWDSAKFFLFSGNVFDPLIYYSHFAPLIVSLLIGGFVLYTNWKSVENLALFFVMIFFSFWVLIDSVLWASEKPSVIMFVWSVQIFLDLLIYAAAALFTFVFIKKRISFSLLMILFLFFIPLFLFSSSHFNLEYFDVTNCDREASEGFLWNYVYTVETFLIVWIFVFVLSASFKETDRTIKRKYYFFLAGILSLLVAFSFGNIVGNFTENWSYGQYGLFGMPVFSVFLSYLVVRYRILSVKLIATQVLVIALVILIGSQLFFINTGKILLIFILTSITFILAVIFGILLIRSVNNEVRRKEELQRLTDDLAEANAELRRLDESKTEFISIASHQLRTPLSAIKGFVALLADGSYGTLPKTAEDIVKRVSIATERLIRLVENLLNISRMEAGRLEYRYTEVDFSDVLFELRDSFSVLASEKEVVISFDIPERGVMPCFLLDRDKMIEVISNLIDNALKYTPHGFVRVRAELLYDAVRISVTDTGMGFSPEMKPLLFQKFSRGRHAERFDTNGSGLGLYVGKRMVEAQGGKIWATSEGEGKGSSFFVSFPIKRAE